MNLNKLAPLAVGDDCVLLLGVCLYAVTVSEVRTLLEDEPERFKMYRVKSREHSDWFEDRSQHRCDIFKMPSERSLLIARLESDIESLQDVLREQEREQEIEHEQSET